MWGECTAKGDQYMKKGFSLCFSRKATALAVKTSAMSSSRQRALCPPVMNPIRLMPFTMDELWPWLQSILRV